MQVLVCAEGFGFGPVSKATSVTKELLNLVPDSEIYFLGRSIAYKFASINQELYTEVYDYDEHTVTELLTELDIDVLLSGMEPQTVLEATSHSDPPLVGFIDSLFWFWDVSTDDSFEETLATVDSDSIDPESFDHQELELLAHAVADRSYVQGFPSERSDSLRKELFEPLKVVGPIVDDRHEGDGPPRLIVSLCGQLNPAVSVDDAVLYAEIVLEQFRDTLETFADRGIQPLVLGNEEVLDRVETQYETTFLEHDQYLKVLDSAALLLCPASLTSTYEAVVYDIPVVFLPEQNDSHWHNYRGLNDGINGRPFDGAILGEHLPQVRDLDEQDISTIYDVLQTYRAGDTDITPVVDHVFSRTDRCLRDFLDGSKRQELAAQQQSAIETQLSSKNGAREVAEDLIHCLNRPVID